MLVTMGFDFATHQTWIKIGQNQRISDINRNVGNLCSVYVFTLSKISCQYPRNIRASTYCTDA